MKSLIRLTRKKALLPFSLLAVSFMLTGCGEQKNEERKMPPPAVSVVTVKDKSVGSYQEYIARTEAVETVELRARVEGFLIQRNFTEGQNVKKNQLLFEIDSRPFVASLKKAEADLASAKAQREKTAKDLTRAKDLFKKGHLSQADLDNQTSTEEISEANVQAAEAGLETARLNLSYTKIYAPIKGQIGLANYSTGNLVGPGSDPLATLISIDPIYVNFQVDEKSVVSYLQESDGDRQDRSISNFNMQLRLPNGTLYDQPGTFNFASTEVNQDTGTLTVRVSFPNPQGIIVPGLYVTLISESKTKTEQPLIPQASVQENQSGSFVLVLTADNKIETRQVKLGRRIGPMWVVTSGIKAGEKIVIEGLQKVRTGVAVNPTVVEIDPVTGAIITPPRAEQGQVSKPEQQQGK